MGSSTNSSNDDSLSCFACCMSTPPKAPVMPFDDKSIKNQANKIKQEVV